MAAKTTQHKWLERKIDELQKVITVETARGNEKDIQPHKTAVTTLQKELKTAIERHEKAEALEKEIEERRNF